MSAGMEAYQRLVAAQRTVTTEERDERDRDTERAKLQARIKLRLPKVY